MGTIVTIVSVYTEKALKPTALQWRSVAISISWSLRKIEEIMRMLWWQTIVARVTIFDCCA